MEAGYTWKRRTKANERKAAEAGGKTLQKIQRKERK